MHQKLTDRHNIHTGENDPYSHFLVPSGQTLYTRMPKTYIYLLRDVISVLQKYWW